MNDELLNSSAYVLFQGEKIQDVLEIVGLKAVVKGFHMNDSKDVRDEDSGKLFVDLSISHEHSMLVVFFSAFLS